MANVLSDDKRRQVEALGRLGWSVRRIEREAQVRRETASAYLKAAGIEVRGRGGARAKPATSGEVITDPAAPKPATSGEVITDPAAPKPATSDEVITDSSAPATSAPPSASLCVPFRELITRWIDGKANAIPVHPVLADLLSRWRHGWGEMFGRASTASDALLPRAPSKWKDAPGSPHTKKTGGDLMDEILSRLEIPAAPMKAHALRSTFISMALEDGADDRLIERVTHSPGKGRRAFDRYDRADYWPRLCAEVSWLSICPSPRARWAQLSPKPSATWVASGRGAAATSPRRDDLERLEHRPSLHVCR
jgi:hypothetical protein